MFRLVLLSACVAVSLACSNLEASVVKNQWAQAQSTGKAREEFAVNVFNRLFDANPATRAVFDGVRGDNVYSSQFEAHALRVFGGLDRTIAFLDSADVLNADLAHLKGQHTPRGIDAAYFDAFLSALMDEVADNIGLCFNQDAWNNCVSQITNGLK